ncbi:PorV/PorQ family protein [candidate division WOR-3 bacterium]|nr:PorV/PorQ family protein [candidate division WOR-3 bacterium]
MRQATMLMLFLPVLVVAGTGVAFLKIPVGPRTVALGEAAVSYVDDASALFYNPAGLANVPSFDLLLSHNQWFLGMNHEYVAGVYGIEEVGNFGLAFDYWGSGSIQGVNIRGETIPGYLFSAADWSLAAGYGRSFGDFAFGFGLKFIHQQMESLSTSAWAFDVGAMYKTPLEGLRVGGSVTNVGPMTQLYDEVYGLPVQGHLGWRYDYSIVGVTQDFILSETEKPGIAAGVECKPVEFVALRVGYRTGSDYDGFSGLRAGLGISWQGIGVDYAFAPYGKLGMTHRISLSYRGPAATDESFEE